MSNYFNEFTITPYELNAHAKHYAVITFRGKRQLACRYEDVWIVDDTCKTINELLDDGLVSEEAVVGWADMNNGQYIKH